MNVQLRNCGGKMDRKVTIINKTKFQTKDIEEITLGLLAGQLAPSFYLICEDAFSCKEN